MTTKRIRVAVLAQEDGFVIPKNIKLLSEKRFINLVSVVKINSSGALENKKSLFIKGFGVWQVLKMGVLISFNKIADLVDSLFGYKANFLRSLKSAAVLSNASYKEVADPNDVSNIKWLQKKDIDLIVSFSAPCVFKEALLKTPQLGCINLHCSLLPNFAGLLPSFWALYKKSDKIGATVHRMDSKIDNGLILGQIEVPLPHPVSMYSVINETKSAGGILMASVVEQIYNGTVIERENNLNEGQYFSWPEVAQIQSFCKQGGRLI